MTVHSAFWRLTGVVLAFAFVHPFRPQRDMYAVETVSILEEDGGSLTDTSNS